ncbi:MAG: flagellar filament capping protein FliD [Actinomycetota bacterium]|nr:flagellar filament capping protein FliD [Actinomycetota bacterium]
MTGLTVAEGVVKNGTDAALMVGSLSVTSSTNTFQDVVPGVTFVANRVQPGVTVDVKTDAAALATKAGDLVKAMNGALEEIDRLGSYNAATKQGGALLADGAVARLRNSLLAAASTGAADGTSFAEVGITLTREGRVTFEEAKFKAALAKDPAKVEAMFDAAVTAAGRSSTATGSLALVSTSANTALGTHAVDVTQAATRATADASHTGITGGSTYRMTVVANGVTTNVDVVADATITDVGKLAAAFQTKASGLGLKVTVGVDPTNTSKIVATMQDYGSAYSVDFVKLAGQNEMTDGAKTLGLDVAGTIGGLTASGSGHRLSTVGVAGAATNIVVDVTPDATGGVGSVTVATVAASSGGLATRLAALGKAASDTAVGSLTTLINSRQAAVKGLNDRIADWDVRLVRRRAALQRQFSNLETMLGRLKDQGGWLAGQIASLPRM